MKRLPTIYFPFSSFFLPLLFASSFTPHTNGPGQAGWVGLSHATARACCASPRHPIKHKHGISGLLSFLGGSGSIENTSCFPTPHMLPLILLGTSQAFTCCPTWTWEGTFSCSLAEGGDTSQNMDILGTQEGGGLPFAGGTWHWAFHAIMWHLGKALNLLCALYPLYKLRGGGECASFSLLSLVSHISIIRDSRKTPCLQALPHRRRNCPCRYVSSSTGEGECVWHVTWQPLFFSPITCLWEHSIFTTLTVQEAREGESLKTQELLPLPSHVFSNRRREQRMGLAGLGRAAL